jgi:hypothetical protein
VEAEGHNWSEAAPQTMSGKHASGRPEDLLRNDGLMKELNIKLMERMLGAELTAHLLTIVPRVCHLRP